MIFYRKDIAYLERAIELSQESPKSMTAYSVGAVIVLENNHVYTGYSRETSSTNHAEEEAIIKALQQKENIANATMYVSMEPCSQRNSKPKSCSNLIIENQFQRVFYAASEPANFVSCVGEKLLSNAGIETYKMGFLEDKALEANQHILAQ